jgi:hypothetical protein
MYEAQGRELAAIKAIYRMLTIPVGATLQGKIASLRSRSLSPCIDSALTALGDSRDSGEV